MGARDAFLDDRFHGDLFCRHDHLSGGRRRAGRRLRDRSIGLDESSAAVAVTLSAWRRKNKWKYAFAAIALVFGYTTITNIIERPDGIKIAAFFIFSIIAASFISRSLRSTEIRIDKIEFDEKTREILQDLEEGDIRIVTNRREKGDVAEYRFKEHEKRIDNHIPSNDPIIFYEIDTGDASEFKGKLKIRSYDVEGYRILRTQAPAVPNAIAAPLMHLRDTTNKILSC